MATWIALLLLSTAGIALVAGEGASVGGLALGEAALPLAIVGLVAFLVAMTTGPNRGRFAGAMRDLAVGLDLRPPDTAMAEADPVLVQRLGNDDMLHPFRREEALLRADLAIALAQIAAARTGARFRA